MNRLRPLILLLTLLLSLPMSALAQDEQPTATPSAAEGSELAPIPQFYVVQSGQNLTIIAELFDVTVEELQLINNLADDAILYVGQELIIPGGEGDAVVSLYTVQGGDTLAQVAASFNTTTESILESNRLINSQYSLTAGEPLAVVSRTGSALPQEVTGTPHIIAPGETLLSLAAEYNLSAAAIIQANELPYPVYLYPGQRLRMPSEERYKYLPGEWKDIQLRPWPIRQGSTVSIYIENLLDGRPSGSFAGQSLHFAPYEDGFAALVGLDAFSEVGPAALTLGGSGNRPWQPFQQDIEVQSGGFGLQYITIPEELNHLLTPEVRQDEDAFLETIYTQFTETQYWDGLFQMPVTNTIVTAPYGDSRSYNGGPVEIYHTGIDLGGTIGTPILAPANGIVIFNDTLELRGGTVIIDHGLGVMSAYFHLSESFVTSGESVVTGQLIASGGSTGLSSGPHLHWDLRIMNVAVNGVQWTEERFP